MKATGWLVATFAALVIPVTALAQVNVNRRPAKVLDQVDTLSISDQLRFHNGTGIALHNEAMAREVLERSHGRVSPLVDGIRFGMRIRNTRLRSGERDRLAGLMLARGIPVRGTVLSDFNPESGAFEQGRLQGNGLSTSLSNAARGGVLSPVAGRNDSGASTSPSTNPRSGGITPAGTTTTTNAGGTTTNGGTTNTGGSPNTTGTSGTVGSTTSGLGNTNTNGGAPGRGNGLDPKGGGIGTGNTGGNGGLNPSPAGGTTGNNNSGGGGGSVPKPSNNNNNDERELGGFERMMALANCPGYLSDSFWTGMDGWDALHNAESSNLLGAGRLGLGALSGVGAVNNCYAGLSGKYMFDPYNSTFGKITSGAMAANNLLNTIDRFKKRWNDRFGKDEEADANKGTGGGAVSPASVPGGKPNVPVVVPGGGGSGNGGGGGAGPTEVGGAGDNTEAVASGVEDTTPATEKADDLSEGVQILCDSEYYECMWILNSEEVATGTLYQSAAGSPKMDVFASCYSKYPGGAAPEWWVKMCAGAADRTPDDADAKTAGENAAQHAKELMRDFVTGCMANYDGPQTTEAQRDYFQSHCMGTAHHESLFEQGVTSEDALALGQLASSTVGKAITKQVNQAKAEAEAAREAAEEAKAEAEAARKAKEEAEAIQAKMAEALKKEREALAKERDALAKAQAEALTKMEQTAQDMLELSEANAEAAQAVTQERERVEALADQMAGADAAASSAEEAGKKVQETLATGVIKL